MNRRTLIFLVIAIVVACACAGYFWQHGMESSSQIKVAKPVESGSDVKYPVVPVKSEDKNQEDGAGTNAHAPIPTVDESDETMIRLLSHVIGQDRFEALFNIKNLVRRFVVTVNNTTDRRLPNEMSIFKPLHDTFTVDQETDGPVLSPQNFARYSPYVDLFYSVESEKLVAIYARYYGLFQSAYRDLGVRGYFNDRLVAVIDSALAAPDMDGKIKLNRSGYYKFADSKLESLPVIQKVLIRMGPTNEGHLKERLRQLREQLVHLNKS